MTMGYLVRFRRNSSKTLIHLCLLCIVFAIVVFSTGCAGTPKNLRWYDGPPLESKKVSVLKIDLDPWHAAMVDEIDGASIRKSKGPEFNNTETIELLPGKHQLSVAYMDTHGHSLSPAILSFKAEEGHLYMLYAASEKRKPDQGLGSILFGGKYYWTAWIIDSESNELVAGAKWETARRQSK
jgi:hypothetical protein